MKKLLRLTKLLLTAALFGMGQSAWAQKATLTMDKGWSLMTEIPANPNLYFFAIYDHSQDFALVLGDGVNQGNTSKTMFYQADVNPETCKDALWTLAKNEGNIVITSANYPEYMLQTEANAAWFYHTNDNGGGFLSWGTLTPTYDAEAGWTLENTTYPRSEDVDASGCLGPWNGTIEDGAEVACNKKLANMGHFDIYMIERGRYFQNIANSFAGLASVDASYLITNANATRRNLVGWNADTEFMISEDDFATKDGIYAFKASSASTLADGKFYQTILNLPKGHYNLSVKTTDWAEYWTGAFLYGNTSSVAFTNNSVSNIFAHAGGVLEYGVEIKDFRSDGTWIPFDNFTLTALSISNYAIPLSAGNNNLVDGTWYKFNVGAGAIYSVAATGAISDITYTRVDQLECADVSRNVMTTETRLVPGTYYIKSSSAQELTLTELEYAVTETYTFKSGSNSNNNYVSLGESFPNPSVDGVSMRYILSDPVDQISNYAKRFAVNKDSWNVRPLSGFSYVEASGNRNGYFSLCNLRNGDKFSIDYTQSAGNKYSVFKSSNATASIENVQKDIVIGDQLVSGTEYTVKAGEGEIVSVDFYSDRAPIITSVTIKTVDATILEPTISTASGVGYTAIKIIPGAIRGNGEGTLFTKYSYVSEEDAKSNGTTYTEVLKPTTPGVIYAYSYIDGGDESNVVALDYDVVAPKLNTPTATFSVLTASGESYLRTVTLATDVSNIDGDVTVAYKYSTDNSNWNDVDANPFVCPSNTTYIKAVADYCDDSDVLTLSNCEFKKTSDMDFSAGSISLTAGSGQAAYGYINSISFADASGFDKLIVKSGYGISYYAGNSNGKYTIAIPLDGQIIGWQSFKNNSGTVSVGAEAFFDNENQAINPSRDRYGNGTDQGMHSFYIYTPVNLIATTSDVVKDGNGVVDLSSKVLWTGNISEIATAVAALDGVTSVKVGHIGYGVTAAQLNSMIAAAKKNSVFVQLPSNSFFETTSDVANLRTNDGVVALYALTDGQDYAAASAFTATAATISRSYTASIVNTICLPFAIYNSEGTLGTFYTLADTQNGDKGVVKFKTVTTTEANKPYLFVPSTTGALTLAENTAFSAAGAATTTVGDYSLVGVQTAQSIVSNGSATVYGFKNDGTLLKLTTATNIKGMRAYLQVTGSSMARALVASFGDDTTGISNIESNSQNGAVYNLNGQRVNNAQKGLYIVNGKKVIMK